MFSHFPQIGRNLQYFVPDTSYTYSQVFMAVELLKHLVKLDHYNVCQLAFSQLNFMIDLSEPEIPGMFDRMNGLVRRSLRRSFGSLKPGHKLALPVTNTDDKKQLSKVRSDV